MKLYHCPPTRSQRALWGLHEAGVDFEPEHVNLFDGSHRKPEYLAIQSRGVLPALDTGDGVMVESAAIVIWAFDRHPQAGLAPALDAPERAAYLQWCVYGPAELDPYLVTITQNTMILPEDERDPAKVEAAKQQLATRYAFLEEGLGGRSYLVGDAFSGADVVIGHALQWATMVGALSENPKLQAYHADLAKRPAFQKTYGS